MKNWIFILCILCMIPTFAFSQSKPQTQTQTAEKEKAKPNTDEFATMVADYYKAWNTLNLQNPAKYYAKDPALIFYDVTPLQYKGWNEYKAGVTKLLENFSSFKLIMNEIWLLHEGEKWPG